MKSEFRFQLSNLHTAILVLVAFIVVGGLIWEFRGIKFYSARIEKKK